MTPRAENDGDLGEISCARASMPKMADPYRTQEPSAHCLICREFCSNVCARCRAPLCKDHVHSQKERCSACEEDFLALVKAEEQNVQAPMVRGSFLRVGAAFTVTFGLILSIALSSPRALILMLGPGVPFLCGVPFTRAWSKLKYRAKRKLFLQSHTENPRVNTL